MRLCIASENNDLRAQTILQIGERHVRFNEPNLGQLCAFEKGRKACTSDSAETIYGAASNFNC